MSKKLILENDFFREGDKGIKIGRVYYLATSIMSLSVSSSSVSPDNVETKISSSSSLFADSGVNVPLASVSFQKNDDENEHEHENELLKTPLPVEKKPRSGSFGKKEGGRDDATSGAEVHTPLPIRREREIEPLLQPDENRFVMFPIRHDDVWELYQKSVDSFWKTEDIDFSKDLTDWKQLTTDEQTFIKMVLAFFAASDGVIVENLALRFMTEVQAPEIRAFYAFQNFMENVHSQTYSLMIDTYIDDPEEKMKLLHAVEHYPCIKKKSDWARKWISDGRSSFATRLLAFAIVEGVYFSSSFASIFWLKRKNILPGLCLSNEYISRDESMHVDHAVLLYKKLKRKVPKKRFVEIMKEAVDIEIDFITVSIPCRMIGMNANLMCDYIRFCSDRLSLMLGYDKIYNSANPFDFMEHISIQKKTNFFEHRVSDYALANKTKGEDCFDMNADF